MSSPFRRSDYSRSSPSRSRSNGYHRSQRNSLHGSPELYEQFARLVVDSDRDFSKKLDEAALEQQRKHVEALELALAKHTAVRKAAEETAERIRLEFEAERVRKEREELERQEEARKRLVAEQQRKEEAARQAELSRRQEEEQRIAAQKKREQDEAARQKAAQEKVDAEKRAQEQAAAEARARAEEEARQRQAQVSQAAQTQTSSTAPSQPVVAQAHPPAPTSTVQIPSGVVKSREQCRTTYDQYLAIHSHLKRLRQDLPARARQDARLRDLSDWRRELTKLLGQVNVRDKAANRDIIRNVKAILTNCLQFQDYVTDLSPYFLPSSTNGQPIQGNILLVFLLHYLVKSAIKSMEQNLEPLPPAEMGAAADNFGIVLATVLATPEFRLGNLTFADVLWSKYYQQIPPLFGVRAQPKRPIRCLVAGFAAITLRDFSKNRNSNPFPSRIFWEAVARIVNTPPANQMAIHYQMLATMFNAQFVPRFIQFYGKAGLVAMQNAIVRFPTTAPPEKQSLQAEAKALTTLAISLDRDLHLRLS